MKAAIYLRVSSDDGRQDETNQEPECLQLCTARGWEPHVFREQASGRREDRPKWREVLELARRGQVAAVVFWSMNRIGRRRWQIAHDLRELMRWKVAVVSVRQKFLDVPDRGPWRDNLIETFAWFAEEEYDEIVARTLAGLARARAAGRVGGRRAILPAEAVVRARELRALARPLTFGEIRAKLEAEGFGAHRRGTIERAVKVRRGV